MKYSNKIKTPWRFSIVIFLTVFTILTAILIALLIKFPIQLSNQNMYLNEKWYGNFVVFWPESSLKHELTERKKAKRYSKLEIQKRIDKQLKLMTFVNSPLYDLWLDKNVEMTTNNPARIPNDSSFWPVLSNASNASGDNTSTIRNRSRQFIVFPDFSKAMLKKGTYLGSGESLRSTIPVSNAKRYFVFEVLPLAPGYTKIAIGQYVWTKTFSENEIHKPVKFFIPINDSLAQSYKLSNISSSFYVLEIKIVSIIPNAREPIYVAHQSPLWTASSTNFSSPNIDPLDETSNQSIESDRDTTLAKGYNTLVISIDDTIPSLLENQKVFSKLMPELNQFSFKSLNIINKLNMSEQNGDRLKIPLVYKKYGYKTVLFSNAGTVFLQDNITSFDDFEKISKSWLVNEDANLEQNTNIKNANKRELDGLNAIFKPDEEEQAGGMDRDDFKKMSAYLKLLSENPIQNENLSFDDHFLLSEKNYVPNLIDQFQKWSGSQVQNRLFINLSLSLPEIKTTTAMQDLFFVLTKNPTLSWKKLHAYIRMHRVDREFKQILDTLQVRHITNRTIVVVLLKNSTKPENSNAFVFIPGLKPKTQFYNTEMTLRNLMFYSMAVSGIPLDSAINFADEYTNPETQQKMELKLSADINETLYTKYNLVIYPSRNNCASFTWRATNASILNVKSNLPFYQISNSNNLEFFPCAFGEKVLEIEWNQRTMPTVPFKIVANQKNPEANHVYGYFVPTPKNTKPIDLYYGRTLISRGNFSLNFHHTPDEMNALFLVDKKEIDLLRVFAIRSFATMRLDSKLAQNTQAALLISKVIQ